MAIRANVRSTTRSQFRPVAIRIVPNGWTTKRRRNGRGSHRNLREMGLLSRADRPALAAYCTAWSRWVEAEAHVKKYGTIVKSPEKGFPMKSPYLCVADQAMETMRKLMVEFGLTPSSRSRIRVPGGGAEQDEFDRFLEAG